MTDDPIADLRAATALFGGLPPAPAALRAGALVFLALALASRPAGPVNSMRSPNLRTICDQFAGVPVVLDVDLPVDVWQVVDSGGNVIRSGRLR